MRAIGNQFRLLAFRRLVVESSEDRLGILVWGMLITWIVGIGRYWDHPSAHDWQYWGLGSLAYMWIFGTVLWFVGATLSPPRWRYLDVIGFMGLCSLPAMLYAIPVERFMTMSDAQKANVWFLAVVALYRVVLWGVFLRRYGGLRLLPTLVGVVVPIAAVVVALTMLNLDHVVFNIMAGIRDSETSANDRAYAMTFALGVLSFYTSPVLFVIWLGIAAAQRQRRRDDSGNEGQVVEGPPGDGGAAQVDEGQHTQPSVPPRVGGGAGGLGKTPPGTNQGPH